MGKIIVTENMDKDIQNKLKIGKSKFHFSVTSQLNTDFFRSKHCLRENSDALIH